MLQQVLLLVAVAVVACRHFVCGLSFVVAASHL
jgi:hypothetical protein